MTERIDELTGLPTTRTGVSRRKEGELGPGASDGVLCQIYPGLSQSCTCCLGRWEVWHDYGRETVVFRHFWPEGSSGKDYIRAFDAHQFVYGHEYIRKISYLETHEIHPTNAPTPGRSRRR